MNQTARTLVFLTLFFFTPYVSGWNTQGQLAFADTAFAQLPPSKQRHFDLLAYELVRQMDSQKRLYLMRTFEGTTAFAHAAVFPDDWRDLTLAQLFERYGDGLPSTLAQYAGSTTTEWHFISQPFNPSAAAPACEIEKENVVSLLPKLLSAYRDSKKRQNQALLLALVIHMVADAHNPMHTITKVNDDCESDLRGTRFCASRYSGSFNCEENLHQAWDRALGFFDEREKIAESLEFLRRVKVDERKAQLVDPQIWADEGFALAHNLYSATEGSGLDSYYIDEGKIISYERIALGAARLALILEQL